MLVVFVVLGGGLTSDGAAAADARKLSGSQIRTRLVGKQLTDEVHIASSTSGTER